MHYFENANIVQYKITSGVLIKNYDKLEMNYETSPPFEYPFLSFIKIAN